MSQENNSDLPTTFSTLNVNAMEFVPSFCVSSVAAPTASVDQAPSPVTESPIATPAAIETPTEDLSPTKAESDTKPVSATPTETMEDKSPENPGN